MSTDKMDESISQLCNSLNLDKQTADDVSKEFTKIREQFIIEGDKTHWLACAIYAIANRNASISSTSSNVSSAHGINDNNQPTTGHINTSNKSVTPAPNSSGVSLTQLLRQCELSLVDFLSMMDKWLKMTEQGAEIRPKIAHLERNFNVSAVVFKKYKEIFPDVFKNPIAPATSKSNASSNNSSANQDDQGIKLNRTRKSTANARQTNYEVTSADVYYFCWTLYINIKATRPAIGEDLVNSYHLLLACIDFCYSNALVSKFAHDVLNPQFKGLPENFHSDDFKMMNPTKQPMCILQVLCNKWDGIAVDAKGIREHWLKPYIKDLMDKKVLQINLQNSTTQQQEPPTGPMYLGVFDACNFESNMSKLTKEHDLTMLTAGDLDERIFLSENANKELGAPIYDLSDLKRMLSERDKMQDHQNSSNSTTPSSTNSSADLDKQKPSLENGGRFVPQTPLSNRNYLANKVAQPSSPVANATRKVGDLYRMLAECTGEPTASLEDIFRLCTQNPREAIMERATKMVDRFIEAYTSDQDGDQPQAIDLARKRAELARKLYFKVLEQIVSREQNRMPTDRIGDSLSNILSHEIFHISLFACCVEIVLASHNAKRTFPWVVGVYKNFNEAQPMFPYSFYKVIELVIREEERLSRDIVKHLATIEEKVLDSMAWEADSPLWTAIAANGSIPSCQDVVLPPTSTDQRNPFESPLSTLRRHHEGFQSPMPVSGRYPITQLEMGGARRRLFMGGHSGDGTGASTPTSGGIGAAATTNQQHPQIYQVAVQHRAENGDIRYVILNATSAIDSGSDGNHHSLAFGAPRQHTDHLEPSPAPIRPAVRANPVNLFFRKVYYLAQLRFRDLWNRLGISSPDLQRKIWTLFEYQVRNHTKLLRDRHLDQMIMCATYAVYKVCRTDGRISTFFQEIMKAYRFQPQANIEVYRNVLLTKPALRLLDESRPSPTSHQSSSVVTRSPSRRNLQSPIRNGAGAGSAGASIQSSATGVSAQSSRATPRQERGDLIQFYNQVYMPQVKDVMVEFGSKPDDALNLSPLPKMNTHPISPWRRVSQQHSVYVSPLKSNSLPASPGRQLSYNFHRSPSKDLQTINNMINRKRDACKRILQDDDDENTKRPCISEVVGKRINHIYNDRRSSK